MDLPDFRGRMEEMRESEPRELLFRSRYIIGVVATFLTALWIRLLPQANMDYLRALDPYLISRMGQAIVSQGTLPAIDAWRYFPYLTPTTHLNLGDKFLPAYLYQIFGQTLGIDWLTWSQVYPAMAGALMVVALYFLGKELFDRDTGIVAAFFLAASPAVLNRSTAGWFEKEPQAGFLMIASLYFVTTAWKRKSWVSGIAAGTLTGISLTVWGGTKYLLLLYPLTAFAAVFLVDDSDSLLPAFTPTLIIGNILPAILNASRASITSSFMMAGLGTLAIVWSRYLSEAYDLVGEARQRYVAPAVTVLGAVLLFLSPLYSQAIAGKVQGLMNKVLQSSGGVIYGTVAENMAPGASQIVSRLGAASSQGVLPVYLAPVSEFFSGWTFALIGISILVTVLGGMLVARFSERETVSPIISYLSSFGVFALLGLGLLILFQGGSFVVVGFAFILAAGGTLLLSLFPAEGEKNLDGEWYLLIPLLWALSGLYGATQRSRLLFLTSQPIALMAGYGLVVGLKEIGASSIWSRVPSLDGELDTHWVKMGGLLLVLAPLLVFNLAAAYTTAQGMQGSPNQAWMENLDYMREETEPDSVILSWWDYGYWFQAIGGRSSIADGGNLGFYSDAIPQDGDRINMRLADFLAEGNYTQHLDWLESLSVDYVTLDASMIGKFSAVSQIHNRNNQEFNAMRTIPCVRENNRCVTANIDNSTYLVYGGRGTQFLVPVKPMQEGLLIDGDPLVQTRQRESVVENFCSENGVIESEPAEDEQVLPGCVAFHPFRQQQQLIYIPPEIMDSTLVNLYIMNAHGMEHFEPVFDNGYVRTWDVDYTPDTS